MIVKGTVWVWRCHCPECVGLATSLELFATEGIPYDYALPRMKQHCLEMGFHEPVFVKKFADEREDGDV